jgi:hypothetical protein
MHINHALSLTHTHTHTQTGMISGKGQIVDTKTNSGVKFDITVGSSIVEMKLIIPLGSEAGQIECGAEAAPQSVSVREYDRDGSVQTRTSSSSVHGKTGDAEHASPQHGQHEYQDGDDDENDAQASSASGHVYDVRQVSNHDYAAGNHHSNVLDGDEHMQGTSHVSLTNASRRAYTNQYQGNEKGVYTQETTEVSLRQRALEALVLVIPANIGVLSDPFRNINNNPSGTLMNSGGNNGGSVAGGAGKKGSGNSGAGPAPPPKARSSLSDVINANTLTGVVIGAVTASVANTVAASSASSSASMGNAFQMIGHAQCECVRL